MTYLEKLKSAQEKNNSWLCVGLDPVPSRMPLPALRWDEPVLPFNKAIIDATKDLVCAYKPNLGFYLQWGAAGVIALERTIAYIPNDIPIILDCKTGDIGSTQAAWGVGLFDEWGVDAVTVNPYVGKDAVFPMIGERPDKAVYILARTSNPGAAVFQGDLQSNEALTAKVVNESQNWQMAGHIGYVVGSTYPEDFDIIRQLAPNANFLMPGIGAQGGSIEAAAKYGPNQCDIGLIGPAISASRSVIYASAGEDFAAAAREAASQLRNEINRFRAEIG